MLVGSGCVADPVTSVFLNQDSGVLRIRGGGGEVNPDQYNNEKKSEPGPYFKKRSYPAPYLKIGSIRILPTI